MKSTTEVITYDALATMMFTISIYAKLARNPILRNPWSEGGERELGYWNKDWQFGDDGKVYYDF